MVGQKLHALFLVASAPDSVFVTITKEEPGIRKVTICKLALNELAFSVFSLFKIYFVFI